MIPSEPRCCIISVLWVTQLELSKPEIYATLRLIVELKSVDQLLKVHEAQILTYMKLAKVQVGLLMNFNVEVLRKGIKRFVL